METTLTPETDAEARLMTLGSDDSCIDVYIERDNRNVEGDFVLADFARKLERECNNAHQKVALLCRDWADDDTRVKEIAKKHGIDAEYGDSETGYFKTCVDVAERMSEAITDLTQRLQERQESFQAQLIRIEDTWREKLRESNINAKIWSEQSAEAIRQVSASDVLNRKLMSQIGALREAVKPFLEVVFVDPVDRKFAVAAKAIGKALALQ